MRAEVDLAPEAHRTVIFSGEEQQHHHWLVG
jgi:hypothetical protein